MVLHCFLFFKDKFPYWESECEKVEIRTVEEESPVEAVVTAGTVAEEITKYNAKKENDISTEEVQAKAKAALLYCKNATEYTIANGGKP